MVLRAKAAFAKMDAEERKTDMEEFVIVIIPFLGTAVGAAMVFFLKAKMNTRLEHVMLGFAAGVMIAASVWSLLIPSIEMAEAQGRIAWLPAASGFLAGVGFLLLSGRLIPSARRERKSREGMVSPVKDAPREEQADKNRRPAMLVLAVTLHNLPEGMAVGVALAGAMTENTGITMAAAMMLSMGIAIQNLPEGAIISMPLRNAGDSRLKAFRNGVLSGAVEPAGAFITVLLAEQVVPVLPYLLAFAAGAMLYVAADELIPGAGGEGNGKIGTMGMAVGFVLMMVLDVAM